MDTKKVAKAKYSAAVTLLYLESVLPKHFMVLKCTVQKMYLLLSIPKGETFLSCLTAMAGKPLFSFCDAIWLIFILSQLLLILGLPSTVLLWPGLTEAP